MLLQIRNLTKGFFAMALLGLIAIAFALWGVNDFFGGIGRQAVATVGDQEITPPELTRELELTLRAQRQQEGGNMSQAEAIAEGMHLRLLESMIARRALVNYADKLNVSASDAQVAARIRQIPSVSNPLSGTFDQAAYDQFLAEYGYARSEFENEMRGDLSSEMVRQALTAGTRAPASFGALVVAYETEQRTISVAEAPMSLAGDIPAPTEAQIQAYYEDSREQLAVPEYRALTLVYARAADFAARVDVPEARLNEEFEARRASFTAVERRTFIRLAAANEQQARDAAARLDAGEAPQAVAQALSMQLTRSENQTREQVVEAPVAEAVFALSAGASRVVRTSLSPWAVVRLESVEAGEAPDLAAAREQLRREIQLDEAGELLNTAIGSFEEARAGGAAIAEAARAAGLAIVNTPPVDSHGHTQEDQEVPALAEHADIVATAFETPEGEASDFLPFGDADVLVAVDSVIPATTRPLEEVRDQLAATWLARERGRRMQELGEEVAAAVAGGQDFAAAARAQRMNVVVTSRPIDRRNASQLPAQRLAALLFSAREGDVVQDFRVDGGALIVARVEAITRTDPATQPQMLEQARLQIQQSLTQSLDQAVTAQAIANARVRRHERVIQQTFNAGQNEE